MENIPLPIRTNPDGSLAQKVAGSWKRLRRLFDALEKANALAVSV
jgi:hypothetical protein